MRARFGDCIYDVDYVAMNSDEDKKNELGVFISRSNIFFNVTVSSVGHTNWIMDKMLEKGYHDFQADTFVAYEDSRHTISKPMYGSTTK